MKVNLELAKTGDKIVRNVDLLNLKPGQNLLICADTLSDSSVVDAVATAAYSLGAQVAVIWFAAEAFEKGVVPKPVEAAMMNADAILELTQGSLARAVGKQIGEAGIRYVCLGGHHYFAESETLIRVIGKVNYASLVELEKRLAQLTKKAKIVRMTNPAGTDVNYEMDPNRPIICMGSMSPMRMLAGLVAWAPIEKSVNGTIMVDGCTIDPPIEHRLMRTPIEIVVRDGILKEIKGGVEANLLKKWFESKDPRTYNVAHFTYGINPGTTIVSRVIEGEHHFGTSTPAFGWQNPALQGKLEPTTAHCDCVVLNVSTWLDGEQIQIDGKFIHPDLVPIVEKLFE